MKHETYCCQWLEKMINSILLFIAHFCEHIQQSIGWANQKLKIWQPSIFKIQMLLRCHTRGKATHIHTRVLNIKFEILVYKKWVLRKRSRLHDSDQEEIGLPRPLRRNVSEKKSLCLGISNAILPITMQKLYYWLAYSYNINFSL